MQPFDGGEPGHTAEPILRAAAALPIAAVLGAALAFRPVRRGTPPRKPAVIQTQIVLAIIGAVVMLPSEVRTDRLSNAIIALDSDGRNEVEWDEKKKN